MTRIAARATGVLLPLLLVVVLAQASAPQPAPTTAGWAPYAELGQGRAFAQVIALPTNEILVVGGLDRNDPNITNSKTELIDVATGTVRTLPQSILGRLHHSLTIAHGDRVLDVGGVEWKDQWQTVSRVDLYSIDKRVWYAGAPMIEARSDHAAVALADGRVMVIGGNLGARLLKSSEIYDVAKDRWTRAADMPRARTQHTAYVLRDGRVLVMGGIDTDGGATNTTFIYDPATNKWTQGPEMVKPRIQQVTVPLANGDLLIAGGDGVAAANSEVYRAAEGRFVASGALIYPRLVAQAARLPDGRVVISGGLPPRMTDYSPLTTTEVWDPATGKWSEVATTLVGRAWGALISTFGGLYLITGTGPGESSLSLVERLALN